MTSDSLRNWSVLLLCTGYGNETLRSMVREFVSAHSFDVHVYDAPDYPVDPTVHSHEACLLAVNQHDIVLAFADERQGGTFAYAEATPDVHKWLTLNKVFDPTVDRIVPTIFQMEVLTAKALRKPVIVFVPRDVQSKVAQTLSTLRQRGLRLKKRKNAKRAPQAKTLIERSAWSELARFYEVPAGLIDSFSHMAFLERLRKEAPNFLVYYDPGDTETLKELISGRLGSTVSYFVREHREMVDSRVERKRNPVGEASLEDLLNRGLILAAPYEVVSGPASRKPLFITSRRTGGSVADLLAARKNVLLLGNPGLGKTTTSLLSYREIAATQRSGVSALVPMYASWKDLSSLTSSEPDDFIRTMIALPRNRVPWPKILPLPNIRWILLLDGFDEFQSDKAIAVKALENLTANATIFVSCREYDFERYLRRSQQNFNTIIKLTIWDASKIDSYLGALKKAKRTRAAAFVSRSRQSGNLFPKFLSLPLWLTMLTFLAESKPSADVQSIPLPANEYDLVRLCADRVAEDEIARYGAGSNGEILRDLWMQTAWLLHKAVRDRSLLRSDLLIQELGIAHSSALKEAVFSCLDTRADIVQGFFHEVFWEYWLAEYIVDKISQTQDDHLILGLLGYQRSVVTNKFVRLRIQARENIEQISDRLRRAFFAAENSAGTMIFAKNQILYLLGRIASDAATRQFLSSIWIDQNEPPFVRYAAAWSEAMLGNKDIENSYYSSLQTDGVWDEINRGYHLYYYLDIDIDEEQVPPKDDGTSPAEATLRTLFRRLQRSRPEHLNLRRIELFTVRRFLETGRHLPTDVSDPKATIDRAVRSVREHSFGKDFARGVQSEAERVKRLLCRATPRQH